MPSPVGHSLIGLAIGCAWLLPRGTPRELAAAAWRERRALLAAVLLANLPDVDYIPGLFEGDWNKYHHLHTHSVGWLAVVTAAAWWIWTRLSERRPRWLLAAILALGLSHLVADLFSADNHPPIGQMLFWPLDGGFYIAPQSLFWNLRKTTVADVFQWHNVQAVLVEVAWLLPLVLIALAWKMSLPKSGGQPVAHHPTPNT